MAVVLEYVSKAISKLSELEASHDPHFIAKWSRDTLPYAFGLAAAYVLMVFAGQAWMKDRKPFNLKPVFIVWNLFLAVFSIVGFVNVGPYFIKHVVNNGLRYSVCHDSLKWWNTGVPGFWFMLFTFSKGPELVDTVFLVFQKKPVIFLHWYHHTTVMLYCWYGYATWHTVGAWFGAMNYGVHAIMYSYYFLMSVSNITRKIVKPIAPLITILQIAQMVAGLGLVVYTEVQRQAGGCEGAPETIIKYALAMYGSYFVLFVNFFLQTYVFKKKKAAPAKVKAQ